MCLLIAGDFVMDYTTIIDVDAINRGVKDGDIKIRIKNQKLEVRKNSYFCAQFGNERTYFKLEKIKIDGKLCPIESDDEGFIALQPGSKHKLIESPRDKLPNLDEKYVINIPIQKISWGGGGLNLVTAIRSISSRQKTEKIKFTSINRNHNFTDIFSDKVMKNPEEPTEEEIQKLCSIVARKYSSLKTVEIYLSSQDVEFNFIRLNIDKKKSIGWKRNLIIAEAHDERIALRDKITLKSPEPEMVMDKPECKKKLVQNIMKDFDTLVINSVKKREFFECLVDVFREMHAQNPKNGIIAMTNANIEYLDHLMKPDAGLRRIISPFKLIFNETEVVDFLKKMRELPAERYNIQNQGLLGSHYLDKTQIIKNNFIDFEDLFKVINALVQNIPFRRTIYITLGKFGSIAIDPNNVVHYVGVYPSRGVKIYDTNACGDYWSAMISLLEHKKFVRPNNFPPNFNKSDNMRIASAIAFCKMTNPSGRVFLYEALLLLKNQYIPSQDMGVLGNIIDGRNAINWNRIKFPPQEAYIAYKKILEDIMG